MVGDHSHQQIGAGALDLSRSPGDDAIGVDGGARRWSQQGIAGNRGVDVEIGGGVGDGKQRELVFNDTSTNEIYTVYLHVALPI